MSLCPECRAITLKSSVDERRLVREYPNNQALYDSATAGCAICLFIIQRNIKQNRVRFTGENVLEQANVDAPIKIFQTLEHGQLNLEWESNATVEFPGGAFAPQFYGERFGGLVADDGKSSEFLSPTSWLPLSPLIVAQCSNFLSDSNVGAVISGRRIHSDVQTKENLQRARSWLQTCLDSHPHCRSEIPHLPTRVIDVGSSNKHTKLVITDRKTSKPYVALSYSWGKSPNLRLVAKDLLSYSQRGIPFKAMPKSVQDAVTMTRTLGIQYLWVDALCIIQDSSSDWDKEAAMMGDIYSNATVVIKAASTVDCQDGLYRARESDKLADFNLKMELEDGSLGFASLRIESLVNEEPLDGRGWCMQESWLARHMLVFGSRQTWWECPTCTLTESGGAQVHGKLGPAPFHKPTHFVYGGKDSEVRDRYSWENVVQDLTSRTFTYADDNLPALAGIAKLFHNTSHVGDTYIAGLWKSGLPRNLLFTVSPHKAQNPAEARPGEYHAPSWSWASTSGGITWEKRQHADDEEDKDKGEDRERDGDGEQNREQGRDALLDDVYASVESYQVTPKGPDGFGKVETSGSITLSTQLRSSWRFWRQGGNNLSGWLLTARKPAMPRPQINPVEDFQATFDGTVGQCSLDWRDTDEDIEGAYELYCVRITTLHGLVLEKLKQVDGFRRRGTFKIWEDVVDEFWMGCESENVEIF